MQQFRTSQWVPFPVELVFAFFANPSNLPHISPPGLQLRIEDARLQPPPPRPFAADPARRFRSVAAGAGSEILISVVPLALLPKRVSAMHRITEFEWNSHFIDEQIRGPFEFFHHRHIFAVELRGSQEGTLVTDEIDFATGSGPLGGLSASAFRGQLEKAFKFRHTRLLQVLAAASQQATRRE
jgi:ligand-binding SRPBCC domain-containing protein